MTYTRYAPRPTPCRLCHSSVSDERSRRFGEHSKIVNDLLADLEDNISREKLRSLLHHSRRLTGFNNRATGVMECIEEVLENGSSSFLPSWLRLPWN